MTGAILKAPAETFTPNVKRMMHAATLINPPLFRRLTVASSMPSQSPHHPAAVTIAELAESSRPDTEREAPPELSDVLSTYANGPLAVETTPAEVEHFNVVTAFLNSLRSQVPVGALLP